MGSVVLPIVALAATERLRDTPGDMEERIERAIAQALIEVTRVAERDRVVLSTDHVEVAVRVEVRVDGVQVPPELDMEDVRRHLPVAKPLAYAMAYQLTAPVEEYGPGGL